MDCRVKLGNDDLLPGNDEQPLRVARLVRKHARIDPDLA